MDTGRQTRKFPGYTTAELKRMLANADAYTRLDVFYSLQQEIAARTPRDVLERAYRRVIAIADAHGQTLAEAVANVQAEYRDELRQYIVSEYDIEL